VICGLRLGGTGADCFDGINGNYWRREQFAGAADVLGTLTAGEQAIVADAVEACGQRTTTFSAAPAHTFSSGRVS
jgi:predicted metalloprotease